MKPENTKDHEKVLKVSMKVQIYHILKNEN